MHEDVSAADREMEEQPQRLPLLLLRLLGLGGRPEQGVDRVLPERREQTVANLWRKTMSD